MMYTNYLQYSIIFYAPWCQPIPSPMDEIIINLNLGDKGSHELDYMIGNDYEERPRKRDISPSIRSAITDSIDDSWMWSCLKGTRLGNKMESVYMPCYKKYSNDGTASKKINNRILKAKNEAKCPSTNRIFEHWSNLYSVTSCVFLNIGWLSKKTNYNNTAIIKDFKSLDQSITKNINIQKFFNCTDEQVKFWNTDPCASKYDDNLKKAGKNIIICECFKDTFSDACADYVKNKPKEKQGTTPEENMESRSKIRERITTSKDDTWMWSCLKGTPLGDKMEKSYKNCFGPYSNTISTAHNKEDCPPPGLVYSFWAAEYYQKSCLLTSIGWVNKNGGYDNKTIMDDFKPLDKSIQKGFNIRHYVECTNSEKEFWESHPCSSIYNDGIKHIGNMIIDYECFTKIFGNACRKHPNAPPGYSRS